MFKRIVIVVAVGLFFIPINASAQRGCCSHHGGVAGCSGGRQLCNDGSLSPTCTCSGGSTSSGSSARSSYSAPTYIYGCTDVNAINYNSKANKDDGSCVAKKYGCMDKDALNYDSSANVSDGSCIAKKYGCMNKEAINYDATANVTDHSCQFKKRVVETKRIKYKTKYKKAIFYSGPEKVLKKGKNGKKKVTYSVVLDENENIISKDKIDEEIIKKPKTKVVKISRKAKNKN